MSAKISLRHRLEYILFRMVEWVVGGISFRRAAAIGRVLGRLAFLLDPRHRRVVRENLRATDLVLSENEITRISRDCFTHFGAVLLSGMRAQTMTREELLENVSFEGLEHWDEARNEGKGFIGLTGHYGNWEVMGQAVSALERPLHVIGRRLDNPLLQPHLDNLRGRFGNRTISKEGAFRDTLRVLKTGGCVGFLLDQDALTNGIFVKFMGQWASTFSSGAVVAEKFDLPIVPIFSRQEPDGRILVKVEPPFRVPRTGDKERDIWLATQMMTEALEARVRQDPSQWFWVHRRFKTRPGEGDPLPAPLPPMDWFDHLPSKEHRG